MSLIISSYKPLYIIVILLEDFDYPDLDSIKVLKHVEQTLTQISFWGIDFPIAQRGNP
jgi:hypothetical protein